MREQTRARRGATTPNPPAGRGPIPLVAADRATTPAAMMPTRSDENARVEWLRAREDAAVGAKRDVDGESESDDAWDAWTHVEGRFGDDAGAASAIEGRGTTGETDDSRRFASSVPTWDSANAAERRRGRVDAIRMKRSMRTTLNGDGHSSGKHFCALERMRLPTRNERTTAPSSRGIANLGNSCYVSATLQMLRSMKCFVNDIATLSDENALTDKPLLRALDEHFSCVDNRSAVGVKREMAKVRDEYGDYEQQDAMEFMLMMLETIEGEIGEEGAARCPSRRNFRFECAHEMCCANAACSQSSQIQENLNALTVDVMPEDENVSLDKLMMRYFERETIEKQCEACGHRWASSSRRCNALPNVFLVHVKRFSTEIQDNQVKLKKLRANIRLPGSLRDVGFDADVQSPVTPNIDGALITRRKSASLLSVVSHIGGDFESGHYIAHVKESPLRWVTYDDERVTPCIERPSGKDSAFYMSSPQIFERECVIIAYRKD